MIVSPKDFVTDVKEIYKPGQASNVACGRVSNSCNNPYEWEPCSFTEIWKLDGEMDIETIWKDLRSIWITNYMKEQCNFKDDYMLQLFSTMYWIWVKHAAIPADK